MATKADILALFEMLYPDISIQYADPLNPIPANIDTTAMEQIPQWQGVRAILDTMHLRITAGVKTIYPATQLCNEEVINTAARYVHVAIEDYAQPDE